MRMETTLYVIALFVIVALSLAAVSQNRNKR
jgi:hypothetical protein